MQATATEPAVHEVKVTWPWSSHERRVEWFYSLGAERIGDCHGGYLNFGLWQPGTRNYLEAAENLVRQLARWGDVGRESVVLDVACGTGAPDLLLARELGPREIRGLDVTSAHVTAARARAASAGLADRIHFAHGSATELPYPDDYFSHVIGIEGPVQFDTRTRFLHEAMRVLRPGGVLLLADFGLKAEPQSALDRAVMALTRFAWLVPAQNCLTAARFGEELRDVGFCRPRIRSAGTRTFPGYFKEQSTLRHLTDVARIRGHLGAGFGWIIDAFAYGGYRRGIVDYLLVRAEKPAPAPRRSRPFAGARPRPRAQAAHRIAVEVAVPDGF